jgi:ribosomal protein S16
MKKNKSKIKLKNEKSLASFRFRDRLLLLNSFKNKILRSKISNKYRICLIRTGRRKNSFFKLVVTNPNRRRVDIIGVFTPNFAPNSNRRKGVQFKEGNFSRHQIDINFEKLFFWIQKRAIPSIFVYHVIRSLGQSIFLLSRNLRI